MHLNKQRDVVAAARRLSRRMNWGEPEAVVIRLSDTGLLSVDQFIRSNGVLLWDRTLQAGTRDDN